MRVRFIPSSDYTLTPFCPHFTPPKAPISAPERAIFHSRRRIFKASSCFAPNVFIFPELCIIFALLARKHDFGNEVPPYPSQGGRKTRPPCQNHRRKTRHWFANPMHWRRKGVTKRYTFWVAEHDLKKRKDGAVFYGVISDRKHRSSKSSSPRNSNCPRPRNLLLGQPVVFIKFRYSLAIIIKISIFVCL